MLKDGSTKVKMITCFLKITVTEACSQFKGKQETETPK